MAETKTITVSVRGELTKSKKGRTYFIVQTDELEQFVCYKANLYPEFAQGVTQVIDWKEGTGNFSPSIEGIVGKEEGGETEPPGEPSTEHAPQEVGMWWKELGNRIGDGSLERDYPKAHVKIKGQYYKKMSEVTGVFFKE